VALGQQISRALVVEDEPIIRMGAVDLCELAGLSVGEASNADQAVQLLSSGERYALLMTDIDMPGSMDGIALAWRARELNPSIAVLVVSGKMIAPQAALPPHSRFFTKPVQEEEILAAISELLVSE
jgi:two-component system, response regulator PdtaR